MCLKKKKGTSKSPSKDLFVCKKCGQSSGNPLEMCKAKPMDRSVKPRGKHGK